MDANTPVRRVHFDYTPTDPSSPLSSLPMSSPPNYTTNTKNNEENNLDESKDEFNSNIESIHLHKVSLASKLQEIAVASSECDATRSTKAPYTHPHASDWPRSSQEYTGGRRSSQELAEVEFEGENGSRDCMRPTNVTRHD